jgi:hypothetical protein
MALTVTGLPIPVPAVPVRGPQVTLLGSSVTPTNEQNIYALDDVDLAALPPAIDSEISALDGEAWTRGFAYWPESQKKLTNRSPGDTTTINTADPTLQPAVVTVQPWLATGQESASSLAYQTEHLEDRVRRHVDVGTPAAIESEFWSGTLAQANSWGNPYLTSADAVDLTPTPGTAVALAEGLSILQEALADTVTRGLLGGQGMIHLMPRVVPNLLTVRRIGKLLLDQLDNIIVPGVGYAGTGPVGNANATPPAGQTWIYATDLVMTRVAKDIKVFPFTQAEALDRGQDGNPNLFTYRGEREVCAYFDKQRHYAVLVTIP